MKFLDPEHIRKAALHLHEHGRELTPDEVQQITRTALDRFRKGMEDQGFPMPADDRELLRIMLEGPNE
jgi:hypothetical protein